MLAQEGPCLHGEEGIHEHVFFTLSKIANFFGYFIEGGGHQRTGRDVRVEHRVSSYHLGNNVLVHGPWRLAIVATDIVLHFLGNHAPALACKHVEHRLGAHNLAHGRYERRIAHFGANLRDFLHHVSQTVACVLHFQLGNEVAHHAAWHLVRIHLHVNEA